MQTALSIATSNKVISAGLLCIALFFIQTSTAESLPRQVVIDTTKADKQRELYMQAKDAFKNNKRKKYEQLKKQLIDYPLYAYLRYNETNKALPSYPYEAVDAFLQDYPKTYLSDLLLHHWLKQLASNNDWKRYIQYYQPHLKQAGLQCLYAYAQIKQGKAFPLALVKRSSKTKFVIFFIPDSIDMLIQMRRLAMPCYVNTTMHWPLIVSAYTI